MVLHGLAGRMGLGLGDWVFIHLMWWRHWPLPPLRRVTFWQTPGVPAQPKNNQKGLGSIIRPFAALRVPSLRSCSGRTALYGPSWASALSGHPWPPPPYARPALGLLKSLVDQEQDQDQQPGQRLANRCALALFIYQRICGVAGRAAPCDLHWQSRPLRGASPLLQVQRRIQNLRNPCRSGLVPRRGPNIHHPCHYQKQRQPRRHP
ncbi:hypothetical protein J2W83_002499 [Pseudomonas hunanensis]|uniref:Uncharacterized protein n=1 Tax=Pseudomonas hunanensis TaxID=1247546 RepID=A0ACC6K3C0_9PSED|nr:hypothetical protein [Pseudomonas hunanensis]